MNHVFISPHPDDVIASCGGTIAIFKDLGRFSIIYTMFSAYVDPPYSQEATELHLLWGIPKDVVQMRRDEDRAATAKLGIPIYVGYQPDSLYRRDKDGNWLYGNEGDIFNNLHKEAEYQINYFYNVFQNLFKKMNHIIYVPLGIGNHVDHIIAFKIGYRLFKDGYKVRFYEDFPYSNKSELRKERIMRFPNWTYDLVIFNEKHLKMKIEAFSQYKSQISMLFGDFKAMSQQFYDWSKDALQNKNMLFGERFWIPRERRYNYGPK